MSNENSPRRRGGPQGRRGGFRRLEIPSRNDVLEDLIAAGEPLLLEDIAERLEVSGTDEREALSRRLAAMERDGQLVCNRKGAYGLPAKMDLVTGRVVGHRDGFGFLVPDDGAGNDLFLPPRQMRGVMHGDRVVARVAGVDRLGRREGSLVDVLERGTREVVGRFFREAGIGWVRPDDSRIGHDVLIPPDAAEGAEEGEIVVAELVEQPTKRSHAIGRVKEVLGAHMAPGMEIDIAIQAHQLPVEWPDAVVREAERFGARVPAAARRGREDLRGLPLVTIDGADARDFDDAVHCARTAKGWRLRVAIADVSAYVKPGSALDEEARLRGNSVYFPERVVPMLPESLSNGLCSLVPAEDRLCMVCEMLVGLDGELVRSRFYEAVMRSHARLTYEEVAAVVVDRDPEVRGRHPDLAPHLDELLALYRVLREARERRGALDLDSVETRIVFDEGRRIERIEPTERNDAHRLIEECMVLANVATALFLSRRRVPALYRIHAGPSEDKTQDVRRFLATMGLKLAGRGAPKPHDYAQIIDRVRGRPEAYLVQTVLLRSLAQAVYSPENNGHFGLALEAYTHFTSPIRRYPDLVVHRAIKSTLAKTRPERDAEVMRHLASTGEHCSMTERRADDATRDAIAWLKCEFMQERVGEEFSGMISGVTSFGLFVTLDEVFVDGLVHVSSLGRDYFHFHPESLRMQGERSGQVYKLGDRIRVRVMRVDLDERKIDFEPAGVEPARQVAGEGGRGTKKARRRGRRRG